MIYTQDGIDYTVEDNIVKGWSGQSPFTRPFWNGSSIEEGWTQADQDLLDEQIQENQYLRETIKQLEDGNSLALDIFSFVRKHDGLTTNQRGVLKSLALSLFQGDIEQSKADFDAIQRPTQAGKMQKIYDRLKLRFDAL